MPDPLVGIVMGSQSDWETMRGAAEILETLDVPHEVRIVSAHRTPDRLFSYAETAASRGLAVVIAGAGGAAHLPGMLAAKTRLPVLGVPVQSKALSGMDSLLSIVQMPKGIPVGTLAIGPAGAANAALLAAAMLAVNDAGLATRLEAWRAAYTLTVESAVRLCRLVVPGMAARGWGRVVVVTSVSVKQPVENLMLSSVLRPAVQALVRTLSDEYAGRGVTVNAVAPGYHTTSAVERLIAARMERTGCSRQDVLDGWTGEIPAGRLGDPDELGALAAFLMSGPAGYITGQQIVADGGWVRSTF